MKTTDPVVRLKQLVLLRKAEQIAEGELLKAHFQETYQSLKPVNIIKRTLQELVSEPTLKTHAVDLAMGLTTGFIAKNVFFGGSGNIFSKLSGAIMEMMVARKVTGNAEEIRAIGSIMLKIILHRCSKTEKTA